MVQELMPHSFFLLVGVFILCVLLFGVVCVGGLCAEIDELQAKLEASEALAESRQSTITLLQVTSIRTPTRSRHDTCLLHHILIIREMMRDQNATHEKAWASWWTTR